MIEKEELKEFRNDFAEAVKDLESQYNIKLSLGTITYSGTTFKVTMSAETADEEERADSERAKFAAMCAFYGFAPEDFMMPVKIKTKSGYTIGELVGFNSRARKNPCIIRDRNSDTTWKCPTSYVLAYKIEE